MTKEQFDLLVGRLETEARDQPEQYRIKVLLLAILGNAYVFFILLLTLLLMACLVVLSVMFKVLAIKLLLVMGVFGWLMIKALWVRIDPPEGNEVTADQAPQLFAMIDALRHALGAPRFHHVLVTDDFNAGVVQCPRLGLLGWNRNYLLIGLPMMKLLSPEQFKAVLAHEFGHLAKGHGRISNWIYRQRLRWARLMDLLAEAGSGNWLFKPFLKWFYPYFNAYSFPLARANEYEADNVSAHLTSAAAAAGALTNSSIMGSYLAETYWPGIFKLADNHPQPPVTPYMNMGAGIEEKIGHDTVSAWLSRALERWTDSDDTHPSLADRLNNLGETPSLALPAEGKTAAGLLGNAFVQITNDFDRRWTEEIRPFWEERYQEIQEGRGRLAELEQQVAGGAELSLQDAFERATLTGKVGDNPAGAMQQLKILYEKAPEDPLICFALGSSQLQANDAAGEALIRKAMELDECLIASGCELIRDFCWKTGRQEEAQEWQQKLVDQLQLQQAADQERNQLFVSDKFERHGLEPDVIEGIRAQLAAIRDIKKVYLVRKTVKYQPQRVCYVLGYSVKGLFSRAKRSEVVLSEIHAVLTFPGETLILCVDGDNAAFGRKFRFMRGSRIY